MQYSTVEMFKICIILHSRNMNIYNCFTLLYIIVMPRRVLSHFTLNAHWFNALKHVIYPYVFYLVTVMSRVTWICSMSCVSCYLDIWSWHLLPGCVVKSHVTWMCGHVTCYLDIWLCHVLPGCGVNPVKSHVTWMCGHFTCYLDKWSCHLLPG